jgi:hypothetical protein
VLADADFALGKRVRQPARNYRHQTLVISDMGFVHAWHGRVRHFMRHYAEQVVFDGLRVEVNDALLEIRNALTKFFIRGALHLHRPPFAIELEAQRGAGFLAPRLACGGLFHFSR